MELARNAEVGGRPEAAAGGGGETAAAPAPGLRLFGVIRPRPQRARAVGEASALVQVVHRNVAALVRAEPFALPEATSAAVEEHHRIVSRAMRRTPILPAPFGVVFRDADAVAGFLAAEYLRLDEGLSFVAGHRELRLELRLREAAGRNAADPSADEELEAYTGLVYGQLGAVARAATRFRPEAGVLLSAAFLVEERRWRQFLEQLRRLEGERRDVVAKTAGPWPPYDFVRMTPRARE